ncbi:apolipoprotein N-acyltransferase [Mesorhizobium sp. WSM2239]|uniref:Apolipoprotein N-acyltransferase n=2 Tax=unclassified Mesorhizobium TaxID=325217 RepID=A0AAU8DAL6_9HYPH
MERLAGRIILLWGWRRALTAFLAGAFAVLAQAPYDFFAACFISFPVLVWLLDGAAVSGPVGLVRRLAPAFAIGWWFGFGYFLGGLWWIGNALLVEAEAFAWALPLAVVGIPVIMALFYGFAAALARLLWSNNIGRIAALALGFGVAEWLRMILFTGFPWAAIGYAAMPVPLLMQSVSVVGLIGMNALAVFVFAMPALLAGGGGARLGFALAALIIAAHIMLGYVRLSTPPGPPERTLTVRIVQPSVAMTEKWDAAVADRVFGSIVGLSGAPAAAGEAKPQFILWPETSVPFLFTDRPDALAALGEMLSDGQILIAGAVRSEGAGGKEGTRYYNSVVAIDDSGEIVDAIDKIHLVPFGEYLPFADWLGRLGLEKLVTGPMDFTAGSKRHSIVLPGGIRALPFICYEIIFPDLVAVDVASTDIIVNVTNDAWFGDTPGPYQHFRQAQVRAVETGLPLVRAANTGISGVIDERGSVVDALAVDARGVIDVTIPFRSPDTMTRLPSRFIGVGILFGFAALALGMKLRQKLRSN